MNRSPRSAAAIVCLLCACSLSPPATPTRFARGAKIPLGAYTLVVTDVESMDASFFHQELPLTRPRPGEVYLSVAVTWDHKEDFRATDEKAMDFMKAWILGRFKLQDATGTIYRDCTPIDANMFRAAKMEQAGDDRAFFDAIMKGREDPSREWVVIFTVPGKARGFTLLVDNLDWVEGQPRLAAIPLGR
ncbi:MAG TPA: hypothetical protein VFG76_12650 [Candidatus Polarisedimenticolia bacterium]|nr:hypothetical protein [Candidatus Polarisedimenticolia bacterium]